jgi:glycine/D-amino acid oxidase-like deaminating enzyme
MRPPSSGQPVVADDIDAAHTISEADSLFVSSIAPLHRVSGYLPDFSALELTPGAHARVGVRPMPKDGLPIIGPLARAPSMYVAATHSGVTLGPKFGDLIARAVSLDEPQKDLDLCRPGRFGQ